MRTITYLSCDLGRMTHRTWGLMSVPVYFFLGVALVVSHSR